jgi:DHA1 family bicyclomycin/chloramphenicol resistance-like MFS transporter
MTDPTRQPEAKRLSQPEFIALMAVVVALVAVSIDTMLPAFPQIAADLSPDAPNRVPLILSVFILSMGIGTFFTGPLSDAFGRKLVITIGLGVYALGGVLAWRAPTLDLLLAARALQGLGAAAPRVVGTAMIRDLYQGRGMARITSFVMTVFMLVPAMAPLLGSAIMAGFGWRAIFAALVLFALGVALWLNLRQPETLPPPARRPFRVASLKNGLVEVLSNRQAMRYILVLTLMFGSLFSILTTIQPIYDQRFGRSAGFPFWFMATAVVSAAGTVLNATLVMRLGMRRLATRALAALFTVATILTLVEWSGMLPEALGFPAFFVFSGAVFMSTGLVIGNLNALALQPLGHIAGLAASVVSAASTIGSALLSVPVALAFDGTPRSLLLGVAIFTGLALWLMWGSLDEA